MNTPHDILLSRGIQTGEISHPVCTDIGLDVLDKVFNDPLYDSVVVSDNLIKVYWENPNNPSLVCEVCSFFAIDVMNDPIEHLYNLACTNPSMIIMIKIKPELFGSDK